VLRWFASNLRHHCARRALTQARLAERVQLAKKYIQQLERAVRAPSFGVVVRLANEPNLAPTLLSSLPLDHRGELVDLEAAPGVEGNIGRRSRLA
jgi:transcriptional regulator with XRE-family HTH domain